MSTTKKGRPVKDSNTVSVSNLTVEFLSNKGSDYDTAINYMKVADKDISKNKKIKPITNLEAENIRMPYWISSDKETLLKVKDKFMVSIEPCEQGMLYSIDVEFCSYCIEKDNQEPIKGYYAKIPTMRRLDVDTQSN